MPDLRQTRKKIKLALGVLLGVDLVALFVLLSPLVGSTDSRRMQLNQLWSELQTKTRQVGPLTDLPKKSIPRDCRLRTSTRSAFPSRIRKLPFNWERLRRQMA